MATKEGPEKEPVSDCSRFSSEHSLEGIVSDESDEYHEDDLPDLVIDAHNNSSFYDLRRRLSTSSSLDHHLDDDSSSSSVIDLLMSIKPFQKSVSTSNLLNDSLDVDESHEEVHAERSGKKEFRVTYMNHRKSYVIPPTLDVYKSYLSLLPDESSHEQTQTEEKTKKRQEEIERVLLQFRSLSRAEQNVQREIWKDELNLVEKEMYGLRQKLRDKMKKRTALKRLLGTAKVHEFLMSNFSQVEQKLSDLTEKTSHNLQTAIAVTAKNASAFQRVAKKSVDHLTHEIRELMSQTIVQNETKEESGFNEKTSHQIKTCDQNSNSLQTNKEDSLPNLSEVAKSDD